MEGKANTPIKRNKQKSKTTLKGKIAAVYADVKTE
jgi:hypothetical protein